MTLDGKVALVTGGSGDIGYGGVLGVLTSTPACPVPVHMMPGY